MKTLIFCKNGCSISDNVQFLGELRRLPFWQGALGV